MPSDHCVMYLTDLFEAVGGYAHASRGEHTSATSRKRDELPVVFPIIDEINELRVRLEKLVARNTKVVQSTIVLQFSVKIQQAQLPARFKMPTMAMYEGKTNPQDHLDAFNDQMDLLQVTTLIRCRCFTVTLSRTTKKWIRKIESKTVVS